ncbi:flavin reductase family protein [Phaeovulum vinaykumarii]|uniref:flavin reductase family protein n=1 Tax=Phaeovulum vinaykumarii TaxID=407234 RepID=UPI000970B4BF|nr:flavin reductase family protein [Phaeovulum vinaykumarii]
MGAALDRAESHAETTFAPDPADPRALRAALGRFATGVTIVTARAAPDACAPEGAPLAITVNSFASVSLDPPLVLWSAARASLRHVHFAAAPAFSIHVLGAEQQALCARFSSSGAGFDGLAWRAGEDGVPHLADALVRFDCTTEARHDGGDHTIIIGRVTRVALGAARAPLVFAGGKFGHFVSDQPDD